MSQAAQQNITLLKKSQVCERLNISVRCLENMVVSGRFPPGNQLGKYMYWSEGVITSWLQREFAPQERWLP